MLITNSKDTTEYSSQVDLEQALHIGNALIPASINDTPAEVFGLGFRL